MIRHSIWVQRRGPSKRRAL